MRPKRQASAQAQPATPLKRILSSMLAVEPTKISLTDRRCRGSGATMAGTPKASLHQQVVLTCKAVRKGCHKSAPVGQRGGQGGDDARLQGGGVAGRVHRRLPAAAMLGPPTPPSSCSSPEQCWLTLLLLLGQPCMMIYNAAQNTARDIQQCI